MKTLKLILALLPIALGLVSLPISLWLQYQVLARVQATELMMLLFWLNVPIIIAIQVLSKIIDMIREKL